MQGVLKVLDIFSFKANPNVSNHTLDAGMAKYFSAILEIHISINSYFNVEICLLFNHSIIPFKR